MHSLHRQSTEQYNMESSRIDLKNSIVSGSVIENTKTDMAQDLYLFHVCEYRRSEYEYRYENIASKYKYLKFVLEYKYQYQVLQLCKSLY